MCGFESHPLRVEFLAPSCPHRKQEVKLKKFFSGIFRVFPVFSLLPGLILTFISCAPQSPPTTKVRNKFPIYLEVTASREIDPSFTEDLKLSIEETLNYRGYSVGTVSNLPALKIYVEKFQIEALDYSPTGEVESYQVVASIHVSYLSKAGKKTKSFTEISTFSSKTVPPKSEEEAIQEIIEALSDDVASMLP